MITEHDNFGQVSIPFATMTNGERIIPEYFVTLSKIEIAKLRITAFEWVKTKKIFLRCPFCKQALYPHQGGTTHFSHMNNADQIFCIYRTGSKMNQRKLDAAMYDGRQIGELHEKLIDRLVQALSFDHNVDESSIVRNKTYVKPSQEGEHGRFPDIRCNTSFGKLVIEVQLSPISLNRLVDRVLFYQKQEMHLIWVTDNALEAASLPAFFWDIIASQGSVAYDLVDLDEPIDVKRPFLLRRITGLGGHTSPSVSIVELADLMPNLSEFSDKWIARWKSAHSTDMNDFEDLILEMRSSFGPLSSQLEKYEIYKIINWLLSIHTKEPIGYKQPNIKAVLNSALYSELGKRCAQLIEKTLKKYDPDLLAKTESISSKISEGKTFLKEKSIKAYDRNSAVELIRRSLFPFWQLDSTIVK